MKIAILSDTHGLLRPQVIEQLKTADAILHNITHQKGNTNQNHNEISPHICQNG